MLGLLFPIVYNFGTNIFLGQISYITQALSTVLQLGVTMDFSIFLLHRYQEEKELRSSNEEAMVSAICKTMTSISASSPDHHRGLPGTVRHAPDAGPRYRHCHGKGRGAGRHLHRRHPAGSDPDL